VNLASFSRKRVQWSGGVALCVGGITGGTGVIRR